MPRSRPANAVFLNVPFDAAYRPLFEALVFCVTDCAFVPRCALETSGAGHVALRSRTLPLLLNVDLPVGISFGKTQLPMRGVLELTTGSIVEINCGANEPAGVLPNHRQVARGQGGNRDAGTRAAEGAACRRARGGRG